MDFLTPVSLKGNRTWAAFHYFVVGPETAVLTGIHYVSSGCQQDLTSLLKEGPTVFVAVFCPKLDARD